MKRHLLFITSTNLASNPRCRKEINLAHQLGYAVTYIAFELEGWTKEKEKQIQHEMGSVGKIYIASGREKLIRRAISAGLELLLRKVYKYISAVNLISFAISRRSLQLVWALNELKVQPDFVIAHNPAAFYPAYYLALKNNIPFAIDIEDYHPGEGKSKILSRLNIELNKKVLPKAAYISFAAPLIKEKTISDIFPLPLKNVMVVNNVFPEIEFMTPFEGDPPDKLKLVWFSQHIDRGRGLEEILPVIENLKDKFEITLIGNVRNEFYKRHLQEKEFVNVIPSLAQKDLNNKLAEFDIGLAIESRSEDLNRNICLTNKIWAYFQAGLFIIASDTYSQSAFLKKFNRHGVLVNLFNSEELELNFNKIYMFRKQLSNEKAERFGVAKLYSWEKEAELLKVEWKEAIHHC